MYTIPLAPTAKKDEFVDEYITCVIVSGNAVCAAHVAPESVERANTPLVPTAIHVPVDKIPAHAKYPPVGIDFAVHVAP